MKVKIFTHNGETFYAIAFPNGAWYLNYFRYYETAIDARNELRNVYGIEKMNAN